MRRALINARMSRGAARPASTALLALAALTGLALLAGALPGAAAEHTEPDPVLFEYRGRAYDASDLGPKLGEALYALESSYHRERELLVDEALFELHIAEESARTGESRREVAERLLGAPGPAEAEIEKFYADNRLRIDGTYEEMRDKIAQHLRREALGARKASLIAGIKRDGAFVGVLEAPGDPPIAFDLDGFPVRGRVDAPVTVVEFGDYQCPRCQRAVSILKGLLERHPETVRLVYLDFPVNRSGISRLVAEGAVCAQAQDAYWSYHDLAFERQARLDEASPRAIAGDLGLDLESFDACLAGPGPRARVRRGEQQARALRISGTPAVYVNGRPLPGSDLAAALEARVDVLARR